MENPKKKNLVLSEVQRKARLAFSIRHHSMDWSRVVFMGLNKINGIEMMGVVSQFDGCVFRAVVGDMKMHQYVSFLDNDILPMWEGNKNLVFMHDKKQSDLGRLWRVTHREVKFLYWPKHMNDQNPFNEIWFNVKNRLEKDEIYDLIELYVSWNDTREDFDNFHLTYEGITSRLQKIIENSGKYIEQ